MPITPTYPGVYIEEIPSGVRTITGVTTSITALVGRTRRGPDNEPFTINSFADFERTFGGLWEHSTVAYALRDFYRNEGCIESGYGRRLSRIRRVLLRSALWSRPHHLPAVCQRRSNRR